GALFTRTLGQPPPGYAPRCGRADLSPAECPPGARPRPLRASVRDPSGRRTRLPRRRPVRTPSVYPSGTGRRRRRDGIRHRRAAVRGPAGGEAVPGGGRAAQARKPFDAPPREGTCCGARSPGPERPGPPRAPNPEPGPRCPTTGGPLHPTIRHITFDCTGDPYDLARFWSALLGKPMSDDDKPGDPEALIEDPAGGPGLLFVRVGEGKAVKNRVHFDLKPAGRTRAEEVARALSLGARQLADHTRPDGRGWVTMADPEGNEFCVERGDLG